MPRYNAEQIYAIARDAGFSPDEAATMTAIALAESGGDSRSHNTTGEDSRGLWQINAAVHPDLAAKYDLWDPAQNVLAAKEISHNGQDVSPWTVTHLGRNDVARYQRFEEEAQAAAVAYGDGPGLGVWTGTAGYRHPLSAGEHTGATTVSVAAHGDPEAYSIPIETLAGTATGDDFAVTGTVTTGGVVAADDTTKLDTFLRVATAQAGDTYIYGVETKLNDPNPRAFDCSELVQWSAHQAGVQVDDGAVYQYRQMNKAGTTMSVEEALHTRGALLFYFDTDPRSTIPDKAHVAISLGDGHTIEARNPRKGVDIFDVGTNRFNYAAYIPGMAAPAPATTTTVVTDQFAVDVTALSGAVVVNQSTAQQTPVQQDVVQQSVMQQDIVQQDPVQQDTVQQGTTGQPAVTANGADPFQVRLDFDPDTLDVAGGAVDDVDDLDDVQTDDVHHDVSVSGDADHDGFDDALAATVVAPPVEVDDTADDDGQHVTVGH